MNKYVKTLLRIGISGALIIILLYTQDIDAVKAILLSYNPVYLLFALVLIICGTIISSIRWRTILETSKVQVSHWQLFILYLKGYFYNNFLPTQMGGDAYKAVALGTHIKDQSTSFFSVFMDRFSGLIVLLIMALIGLGSLFGIKGVLGALLLLVIGIALYFPVLNFFAKRFKFFAKFKEASDLFVKDKKRGILVLFYSFLVQLFSFSMVYVLFLGLGVVLPLWSVFAFMPITSLSLLIPSFNGFGTQETVYSFLFKNVGVTVPQSITVSILIHATRLILSLFGGILILFGIGFGAEVGQKSEDTSGKDKPDADPKNNK